MSGVRIPLYTPLAITIADGNAQSEQLLVQLSYKPSDIIVGSGSGIPLSESNITPVQAKFIVCTFDANNAPTGYDEHLVSIVNIAVDDADSTITNCICELDMNDMYNTKISVSGAIIFTNCQETRYSEALTTYTTPGPVLLVEVDTYGTGGGISIKVDSNSSNFIPPDDANSASELDPTTPNTYTFTVFYAANGVMDSVEIVGLTLVEDQYYIVIPSGLDDNTIHSVSALVTNQYGQSSLSNTIQVNSISAPTAPRNVTLQCFTEVSGSSTSILESYYKLTFTAPIANTDIISGYRLSSSGGVEIATILLTEWTPDLSNSDGSYIYIANSGATNVPIDGHPVVYTSLALNTSYNFTLAATYYDAIREETVASSSAASNSAYFFASPAPCVYDNQAVSALNAANPSIDINFTAPTAATLSPIYASYEVMYYVTGANTSVSSADYANFASIPVADGFNANGIYSSVVIDTDDFEFVTTDAYRVYLMVRAYNSNSEVYVYSALASLLFAIPEPADSFVASTEPDGSVSLVWTAAIAETVTLLNSIVRDAAGAAVLTDAANTVTTATDVDPPIVQSIFYTLTTSVEFTLEDESGTYTVPVSPANTSNTVIPYIAPSPPSNVKITGFGNDQISCDLSWDPIDLTGALEGTEFVSYTVTAWDSENNVMFTYTTPENEINNTSCTATELNSVNKPYTIGVKTNLQYLTDLQDTEYSQIEFVVPIWSTSSVVATNTINNAIPTESKIVVSWSAVNVYLNGVSGAVAGTVTYAIWRNDNLSEDLPNWITSELTVDDTDVVYGESYTYYVYPIFQNASYIDGTITLNEGDDVYTTAVWIYLGDSASTLSFAQPPALTGLAVVSYIGPNSVRFSWTAPTMDTNDSDNINGLAFQKYILSLTDSTGASLGLAYNITDINSYQGYTVTGMNGSGGGIPPFVARIRVATTAVGYFQTSAASLPVTFYPYRAPSSLSLTEHVVTSSSDSMHSYNTLAWATSNPSSFPTPPTYHILRSENSTSSFVEVHDTSSLTWDDTNVVYGTVYYYQVYAVINGVSTTSSLMVVSYCYANPYAPSELRAIPDDQQITYTWTAPDADNEYQTSTTMRGLTFTGYRLTVTPQNGSPVYYSIPVNTTIADTDTSYVVEGLVNGVVYTGTIEAVGEASYVNAINSSNVTIGPVYSETQLGSTIVDMAPTNYPVIVQRVTVDGASFSCIVDMTGSSPGGSITGFAVYVDSANNSSPFTISFSDAATLLTDLSDPNNVNPGYTYSVYHEFVDGLIDKTLLAISVSFSNTIGMTQTYTANLDLSIP